MTRLLAPLSAALLLGCTATHGVHDVDPHAFKSFAISQIEIWNAAGIDPVQARPETLALMAALCGSATSLSTVIDPTTPDTPAKLLAFCTVVAKAAAPAA